MVIEMESDVAFDMAYAALLQDGIRSERESYA